MTKREATRAAKGLLARMKTKGWKIAMWNNCGWHFNLYLCNGEVTLSGTCSILGCLDGATNCGEPGLGVGDYRDPNRAVDVLIRKMQKDTAARVKRLAMLERALKGEGR